MPTIRLTLRACARALPLTTILLCASACGDETSAAPPATRKPVERGEAARGASDPMPRDPDAARDEGDGGVLTDGGLLDGGLDPDAGMLPMMLRDGGPIAGGGGVGGRAGVGGLSGEGGSGGVAAIGGTFEP